MEKESMNIFGVMIFIIIILAALIVSIRTDLTRDLTGKITQMPMSLEQIISEAKTTMPATAETQMMAIKEALIDKETLEKLEKIEKLPETECVNVLIHYQPEIVEQTIKEVEEIQPQVQIQPPSLPFEIAAIAPIEALPSPSSLPFKSDELEAKIREITVKNLAIKKLHEKTIEQLTSEQIIDVHEYKNMELASGCLFPDGLKAIVNKEFEVAVYEDVLYQTHVQESIDLIGANVVWKRKAADQKITGKGINVAVIDSGIDYRHDKLGKCIGPDCKVIKGWNTISHNKDVIDTDGHGTHLAGIIASTAPEANLIAVKACQGGYCSASKIAEGIDWCLDNDCHVATLSLGDGGSHPPDECKKLKTLKPVFEAAIDRGLVIFVSSGNEGKPWPAYPACDANVISVGSVNDYDDLISDFSNLHPDILAPGASITSTWLNNEYAIMRGTSQAAAFAAATAALYIQTYAALKKAAPTPLIIKEQFETTGALIYDRVNNIQYPRINAAALVNNLVGEKPLPSFICGDFRCEFEIGEDAQNCPQDCKILITPTIPPTQPNYTLSLNIKDWQGIIVPIRIEARAEIGNKIFVKDFMYDYYTTEIKLPEAIYNIKLSYGNFSAVIRSINLNKSLSLEIKLEDLTKKVSEIPEFPYAQIKAVYGLGFDKSVIICFDRQLAGNNTFVFRCPWHGLCVENWQVLMSMKPRETSCMLLMPREGAAFAVVEIPEAVCGNNICEQPAENDINCPKDCKLKEAALITEKRRPAWPLILAVIIAIALIIFGALRAKRKRRRLPKPPIPQPPTPPKRE